MYHGQGTPVWVDRIENITSTYPKDGEKIVKTEGCVCFKFPFPLTLRANVEFDRYFNMLKNLNMGNI